MSLATLALRLVTVRALTDATLAGGRVYDSEVGVIDQKASEARAPFLLVFTDDVTIDVQGRALFAGDETRKLRLVIETAVSEKMSGEGDQIVDGIPETDAGREMTLDVICRQVTAGLVASRSPWAELWRKIVMRIEKIEIIRGADASRGVRFAAKQIAITLDTIGEPAPGEGVDYGWGEIVSAIEADAKIGHLGAIIRGLIAAPAGLQPWQIAQAQLGLTAEGLAGIGLAPLVTAEGTGGPVQLDEATIDAQAEPPIATPPSLSSDQPNEYDPGA